MASLRNRTPLYILLAVILLNTLLLFGMRLLPFADLPNHLAEATIFKYAGPQTDMGRYYQSVPWYYPNTFHTVFCSLFPSVEWGNKLFYVLYVTLLLLAVYAIIKKLRGNLWYGLLAVLYIYNYNTTSGFSGYTIAVPTTLVLFYVILCDVARSRWAYTLAAAGLLVLLYLMHAQMALFGLLLYGLSMLYRYWGAWKVLALKAVLVPLPLILMIVAWWGNRAAGVQEQSTLDFLAGYYTRRFLPSFPMRARLAVFDNFSLRDGKIGLALAAVLFALVLLPLLYFNRWKALRQKTFVRTDMAYTLLLLLVSAGCYFFLPNALPGQAPLYERFSVMVMLAAIIAGSVLLRDVQARWFRYFVCGAVLLYTVLWAEYIYTFNKDNRGFTPAFLKGVSPNTVVGGLMYNYKYRGRYIYLHFPSYHIVWHKGLATSKAIDFRFGVVMRGERGDEIPFYREWIGRNYKYVKAYDTTLNYVLVRGKAPAQPDSNLLNKMEVGKAGAWRLYRNDRLRD